MKANSRAKDTIQPGYAWPDRLAWYATLACVAIVPLATSLTRGLIGSTHALTSDPFQAPKAFALSLLTIAAIAGWACDLWLNGKKLRVSPALAFLGVFALIAIASTALSTNPVSSLLGASGLMTGGATWLCTIALAFLLSQYVNSGKRLLELTHAVMGSLGVVALIAVLQSVRLDPFAMPFPEEEMWWVLQGMSTTGNPNATGLLLVLPTVLGAALALAPGTSRRRQIAAAAGVICGAGLFITLARASWIGAAASVLALLLLAGRIMSKKLSKRDLGRLLAVVVAVVVIGTLLATPHMVGRKFEKAGQGLQSFSTGRLELWGNAIRVVQRKPLLGSGPDRLALESYRVQRDVVIDKGNRYVPQDPHNVLLLIPAVFGIPALLVFLAAAGMSLLEALRALMSGDKGQQGRMLYAGWIAGFIGILIASLLSVWTITSIFIFFVALGALMGPTLHPIKRPTQGTVFSAVVISVALAVAFAGVFGSARMLDASYHYAQARVRDGQRNMEQAWHLVPWDGGVRTNYLFGKIGASGQALTSPDVALSRKTADELDADVRAAIAEFPDELLLYRLRMDLHASLRGYPGYQPEALRQAIEDGLKEFPSDPEFKDRLADLNAETK